MSDVKNGLVLIKRVIISLSENKQSDLSILVNGLLEVCIGVKIYVDNETYPVVRDIFAKRPGRIKGGELHRLEFEPIKDIDLALIGPKVLEEDPDGRLFNPEEVDDRRFNLIMTMATDWNRTLTFVNPTAEIYSDLIAKLQSDNGKIGTAVRLIYSFEALNFLHDKVGEMLRGLSRACD